MNTPQLDVKPTSAEEALAELTRRGYDTSAACRYAKAARSWEKKDSPAWNVWKQVEVLTTAKENP
jgi:hypothetical protein